MKLNRNYWVWVDPMSGHVWDDNHFTSKKESELWRLSQIKLGLDDAWRLKLKKIRIVEVKEKV